MKATNAVASATPANWLLINDDIVIPMQEASAALVFVEEFMGLLAQDSEHMPLGETSWTYLAAQVFASRQKLEAAIERIKTTVGPDLLQLLTVHTPPLVQSEVSELWAARAAAEMKAVRR